MVLPYPNVESPHFSLNYSTRIAYTGGRLAYPSTPKPEKILFTLFFHYFENIWSPGPMGSTPLQEAQSQAQRNRVRKKCKMVVQASHLLQC